jgi:uroporphyrin-III C-methyltransferase
VSDFRTDRDRDGRLVVFDGRGASNARAHEGRIWLVGAGPGDPELLTLKAARVLAGAEVLIHDRLIPDAILDLAPPTARRIFVGKRKAHHSVPQDEINGLLVALALEGFEVVRLKGGDPFIFGRGGEELAAARAAGVPCEVVPGVSAGIAASASTGAPLTHRGLAQAVTFVTGHAAPDGGEGWSEPVLDWAALARPNHTVVVYMGVSTAAVIARRLTEAGRAPQTPALIVENASRPDERRLLTTIAGLAEAAGEIHGPAVLIVGEIAALADIEGVVDRAALEVPDWKRA